MGHINISDGKNNKISYLSCRQLSEGAYLENRDRFVTVTFKHKFINVQYIVGTKGNALNYGRIRLLRHHQLQR